MDIATGAMKTVLPKLAELVVGEYKLQKGVKGEIKELKKELEGMSAALRKVAEVPVDQLDEQVKIWARDVRELSYDIEDYIDTFMLRGKELGHTEQFSLKGLFSKATDLYKKAKTNHEIHNVIKDIMDQVKKVAERRDRYKVDNITPRQYPIADPRLEGLYKKATDLVGIDRPKEELAKRLLYEDCSSSQKSDIISIVGFGGLGKTTLAKSLLQDLKAKFDCHFLVSVSFNPDIKRIFKNILIQLDEERYGHIDEAWEVNLLIDRIIEFLKNKRFLCVIDDLWEVLPWDAIKLALQGGNDGSKIIITTRNKAIAQHVGGFIYELQPLSSEDSIKLFNKRIFDTDDGCPPRLIEVTEAILKKCGGVPLAIITISSLLASKTRCLEDWGKVNESIGSGLENSLDVDRMRKILSLSYIDLPFHLKTCLLSLSKYPEDHVIRKDVVVWSWIAEGFITENTQIGGASLQVIGEGYFVELIDRSLIQPVNGFDPVNKYKVRELYACQVHDMILELILKLSAEEDFAITTSMPDAEQGVSAVNQREIIRRLSLHNCSNINASISERKQLSKVRSLYVFGKVKSILHLSSFHVLRVLQVDDCTGLESNHLNDLCELCHLRLLQLHGVRELPESIGKLESLEILDIRGTWSVIQLPASFGKLCKLVRLLAGKVKLPDGLTLENMKSLQELVGIVVTLHAVTEICRLRELKVLGLCIMKEPKGSTSNSNRLTATCLQKCTNLQVLILRTPGLYYLDFMAHVPVNLQRISTDGGFFMKEFPRWINPSLSCLTILSIRLYGVRVLPEHLEKLADLPSLRLLTLQEISASDKQEKLIIHNSASAFSCLTDLEFRCALLYLKFQHGAMRKLQRLFLSFSATATNQHFSTNNFDYGFENLPSLRHVIIELAAFCPKAEVAIRKAINDHPNHPSLELAYR